MIKTPVSQTPLKLFAPYLPQSNRQGIGALAATHLLVNIDPYPDMESGDLIELFWGDCYVASTLLSDSDIGYTTVLHVPESFLQTGKVKTYYRVTKIGSEPVKSPGRKMWVKLEIPGGHLVGIDGEENQGLAPVKFSEHLPETGLTSRHLDEGIELVIERYPHMEAYDEITLRWGDRRMDFPALTEQQVGSAIKLHVPGDLIREAGDDEHQEVTYCIIDRVGNNSLWAPPRSIRVNIPDGASLEG
ncbi:MULTISPECIES: hypothetical protein [unclassified Pseudomonas]|uniref:hypothetical protein n=1 Tax=unclassified Pseudomonas TaxID=196821 RepID=UPI00384CDA8E